VGAPAREGTRVARKMLSSASFRQRRRDCLHQTPIEAQPLPGQRCGAVAPRPRNVSVPSCRPIQSAGSRSTHRVQLCVGLGGGAEQSSSLARVPDVPQHVSRCFALFCLRLVPSALRRRREGSRAKPRSGRRSRPLSPRVLRRDNRKSRRSSVAEQGCAVDGIADRAAYRGVLR
jgi:hypothetical protein